MPLERELAKFALISGDPIVGQTQSPIQRLERFAQFPGDSFLRFRPLVTLRIQPLRQ